MGISVPSPVISSGRTAFMIVSETARNGQKDAERTPQAPLACLTGEHEHDQRHGGCEEAHRNLRKSLDHNSLEVAPVEHAHRPLARRPEFIVCYRDGYRAHLGDELDPSLNRLDDAAQNAGEERRGAAFLAHILLHGTDHHHDDSHHRQDEGRHREAAKGLSATISLAS